MTIAPGATSNSIQIGFYDDSGLPLTGKVAADFPTVSYQKSGANAAVTISLSDLAALTTAWSSGGVKEIGNGHYRLDVPDAAFTVATRLDIGGDTTGKHVIAPPIDVQTVAVDAKAINGVTTAPVTTIGAIIGFANAAGAVNGPVINGANTGPLSISGGVTFSNSGGDAFVCSASGGNGSGINASGNGTGDGLVATGGATGRGLHALGGATSGEGLRVEAVGSGNGLRVVGIGTGLGISVSGGATGAGMSLVGGATSGNALTISSTNGHGIDFSGVAGVSKHGLKISGGSSGVSDGINVAAGSGGVEIRAATISGTLATVTTATTATNLTNAPTSGDFTPAMKTSLNAATPASVTGAVGSVAGAVGSVTGNVGGNVVGSVGSVVSGVTLAASQPNYAPSKAGDKMDLVDAPNGAAVTAIQNGLATATNLAAVKTDTGNLVSRVGAWTGSGNNTMLGGMRALANKLAGLTPTDLTSGGGTFDSTEDSAEAIRDHGDVAWVTGSGGGGGGGGSGSGDTPVTENTGGTDNLRAVDSNGNGLDNVIITAYLTSDWTANPITATALGQIQTKADGRFVNPLMLNAGLGYTLVYQDQGHQTVTKTVTP